MGRDHFHCAHGSYGMPCRSFKLLKGAFAKSAFSSFGQRCSCALLNSPSPVLGLKVDVTFHQHSPGTCLDHLRFREGSKVGPWTLGPRQDFRQGKLEGLGRLERLGCGQGFTRKSPIGRVSSLYIWSNICSNKSTGHKRFILREPPCQPCL